MYSRNKKDNYRKKIEELIGGRPKRSRKDTTSSSNFRTTSNDAGIDDDDDSNDNTNNDNDNTSDFNEGINIISNDFNEIDNSSGSASTSKIRVQKWIPGSTKVEGIRKYSNILN